MPMKKEPEQSEAEKWRAQAARWLEMATKQGTQIIQLEAEVQRLLAELEQARRANVGPDATR